MEKREPSDLDIDLGRLEWEWARQPGLREESGRRLAGARLRHSEAKDALAVTEAEVALEVRDNPSKFGLQKATEASIEAATTIDVRVGEAKKLLNRAKHAVDVLESYVAAVDHKKHALQDEVQMLLAGFFAAPRSKDKEWG